MSEVRGVVRNGVNWGPWIRLGVWIFLTTVIALFAAWQWGVTKRLDTKEVARIEERGLGDLWFSPRGQLVGVRQQGWIVTVWTWRQDDGKLEKVLKVDLAERMGLGKARSQQFHPQFLPSTGLVEKRDVPRRFRVQQVSSRQMRAQLLAAEPTPLQQSPTQKSLPSVPPSSPPTRKVPELSRQSQPPTPPVAVSRDASRIAWVGAGSLLVQDDSAAPPFTTRLKSGAPVSTLAFTENGRLALMYDDGDFQLWDADFKTRFELIGPLSPWRDLGKFSLRAFGPFVATASFRNSVAVILDAQTHSYHIHRLTSPNGSAFAVSSSGRLAIGTEKGTVLVRKPKEGGDGIPDLLLEAPGPVRALAFYDEDRLLVGGDFRGVHLLAEGSQPRELAIAPVGTRLLAVTQTRFVYGSPSEARLLEHHLVPTPNAVGISIAAAWLVLLAIGFPFLFLPPRAFSYLKVRAPAQPSTPPTDLEATLVPIPEPPDKLVEVCAATECVLYVGAGLSAQAGFPTWSRFLRGLLDWAINTESIEKGFAESLRAALEQGQYDPVADSLVSTLQSRQRPLNDYLRKIFLDPSRRLPKSLLVLKDIPFSAVLTTNFDNLLERTFAEAGNRVFTPKDAERLLESLGRREFFLLKLYGTLEQPDSVLVAPAQYADAMVNNLPFSQFMENLFFSRTLFFVGASLEGIESYLSGITFRGYRPRTHYALVGVSGGAWQAKADLLKRRYGIEVLPYSPAPDHPEVLQFLNKLTQAVRAKAERSKEAATERQVVVTPRTSWLKQVKLTNIGPFEDIELELDPHWNVLLGDNGVGKSTILKAIAIALCPKEAQPYAGRLIRSGATSASIILTTDQGETYLTQFLKKNGGAEITTQSSRPISAEGWLVLGFPPLRTVTWERPRGPQEEGKGTPTPDDLLALIKGDSDPRLDKLKQWIVNLDYRIKDEMVRQSNLGQRKTGKNPYEELRDELFRTVAHVTPGLKVEFKEVDPKSKQVTITTDDGDLPIESISQGTTSLIAWVGVLLQRLYELYGRGEEGPQQPFSPREGYALVLIDEIDAHMHPAWQQTVVHNVSHLFPNVQFIATTHSPLIVGGMPAEQVFRFKRNQEDKVVQIPIGRRMTMGRADQILTGGLFGLESALDVITEQEIVKYQALLAKGSRSPEEEREYQELRRTLEFRIPATGPSPVESRAKEVLEALLLQQFGDAFPQARQKALEAAQSLLDELRAKRGKES